MSAEPVEQQEPEAKPVDPDLAWLQDHFGPPQPRDPQPGQLRLLPEEEPEGDEAPAEEDEDGR